MNILRPTPKRLRQMKIGETRIFAEAFKKGKAAGTECTAAATRGKVKIQTAVVYIFYLKTETTQKAVAVTRME